MTKIFTGFFIICSFWFLCGSTSFAQDNEPVTINWTEIETAVSPLEEVQLPEPHLTNGSHGERQTYLQAGEQAPWAGILLNPAAAAYIIAETQASYSRANLALSQQRNLDFNRLQMEVGQLRLQLRSDRQQADIVIRGLNQTVERTMRSFSDYVDNQHSGFWSSKFGQVIKYGLVVVGSAAVGFVVGYVITR